MFRMFIGGPENWPKSIEVLKKQQLNEAEVTQNIKCDGYGVYNVIIRSMIVIIESMTSEI